MEEVLIEHSQESHETESTKSAKEDPTTEEASTEHDLASEDPVLVAPDCTPPDVETVPSLPPLTHTPPKYFNTHAKE